MYVEYWRTDIFEQFCHKHFQYSNNLNLWCNSVSLVCTCSVTVSVQNGQSALWRHKAHFVICSSFDFSSDFSQFQSPERIPPKGLKKYCSLFLLFIKTYFWSQYQISHGNRNKSQLSQNSFKKAETSQTPHGKFILLQTRRKSPVHSSVCYRIQLSLGLKNCSGVLPSAFSSQQICSSPSHDTGRYLLKVYPAILSQWNYTTLICCRGRYTNSPSQDQQGKPQDHRLCLVGPLLRITEHWGRLATG